MAHQQKYYKYIEANGHLWRLEIWQDTEQTLTPVEIGPVLQALRLVVQGDQADIDTPIVKTSLEMSFVDAPGLEYERKCGYWEEFYTSSSTEYKVLLRKDGVLEWSGYVTPDSFAEDLRYRGSVSIIARDNLGTLQDTTFYMGDLNEDGKVHLWNLINKALYVSTCALDCDIWACEAPTAVALPDPKTSASGMLLYQMVDVYNFDGKNWWEVLEKVLYSVGLSLRYVGENRLALMPLRDLPKYGAQHWWDVPVKDVKFLAYGRRELVPGIKDIKETIEYDIETESVKETIDDYVPDQTAQLECINMVLSGPSSTWSAGSVPVHGYKKNRKNEYLMPEFSSLLDVSAYAKVEGEDSEEYGQWDDKGIIYFAMNSYPNIVKPVQFIRKVHTAEGKVDIKLSADKPVTLLSDYSGVLNLPINRAREYGTGISLEYALIHEDATTQAQTYYDATYGTWSANEKRNSYALGNGFISADKPNIKTFELKEVSVPSTGTLIFEIRRISTTTAVLELRKDCVGIYLRIKDVSIDVVMPEETRVLDKVSLTTKYSDKYSVRITRNPELGINPTSAPEVAYVPNAIVSEEKSQYIGAEQWVWPHNMETLPATGMSLSTLIHQQILAYHSAPNNVLTGELLDAGGNMPDFRSLWMWNNKLHMLISGTLNVLTGRMESATLREFVRYDHMWETWVENEDVVADYTASPITFLVHSNKALDHTAWAEDIPEWILLSSDRYNEEKGVYEFRCNVFANTTGLERVAQFKIDTAEVRITQRAAGDYSTDYGMDYA